MSSVGFDRFTYRPDVMEGRACIRGMRVSVSLIINLVATRTSTKEIIEAYLDIEPGDISPGAAICWLAENPVPAQEAGQP